MLCHQATQRKQRLLQSDQEQTEPDNDKKKADGDLFPVRHRPADHQPLEGKQEYYDRQHIDGAVGNGLDAGDDQFHSTIIP